MAYLEIGVFFALIFVIYVGLGYISSKLGKTDKDV